MLEKDSPLKEVKKILNSGLDFGRLGPLGIMIEQCKYQVCRFSQKPYFGSYLAARQGFQPRHRFMAQLLSQELTQARSGSYRLLEIGSWAGGSTILWAKVLQSFPHLNGKVFCVDPWISYIARNEGTVYRRMEKALQTGEILELFYHNIKTSGCSDIVHTLRGTSRDIMPLLKEEQFDFIYVDGDHSYDSVFEDITLAKQLLKQGGILCGDDMELTVDQVDFAHSVQNKQSDFIKDPKTGDYFHPGVTLAVADCLSDVSRWEGFWAVRKTDLGWSKVTLQDQQ